MQQDIRCPDVVGGPGVVPRHYDGRFQSIASTLHALKPWPLGVQGLLIPHKLPHLGPHEGIHC